MSTKFSDTASSFSMRKTKINYYNNHLISLCAVSNNENCHNTYNNNNNNKHTLLITINYDCINNCINKTRFSVICYHSEQAINLLFLCVSYFNKVLDKILGIISSQYFNIFIQINFKIILGFNTKPAFNILRLAGITYFDNLRIK